MKLYTCIEKKHRVYKELYKKDKERKILRMAYVFVFKWLMFSSTAKQLNYWRSFNLFFLLFQLFFLNKTDEMLSLAIFQETLNKCENTKDDFFIHLTLTIDLYIIFFAKCQIFIFK